MDNKMDIKIIIKTSFVFKISSKKHEKYCKRLAVSQLRKLFVFMRKRDLFTAKYIYCLASILLKHGESV